VKTDKVPINMKGIAWRVVFGIVDLDRQPPQGKTDVPPTELSTLQYCEVEDRENDDNSHVGYQPLRELVPQEENIHQDNHDDHHEQIEEIDCP
jgi:hypothetical protein